MALKLGSRLQRVMHDEPAINAVLVDPTVCTFEVCRVRSICAATTASGQQTAQLGFASRQRVELQAFLPELLMLKRDELFQRADAVLSQNVLATQAQFNVKALHGIGIRTRIVDLAGFICVDRQDTAITTAAFCPLTAVKVPSH